MSQDLSKLNGKQLSARRKALRAMLKSQKALLDQPNLALLQRQGLNRNIGLIRASINDIGQEFARLERKN